MSFKTGKENAMQILWMLLLWMLFFLAWFFCHCQVLQFHMLHYSFVRCNALGLAGEGGVEYQVGL